ncbi:MAG: ATP-dependent RecD-like DNA helicase [Thermodesulfobacteriota bacterium]
MTSPPALETAAAPPVEIQGVLERITFQNEDSGFTVARLAEAGKPSRDLTTVVGTLAGVPVGSTVALSGWWVKDARHGWQFKVNTWQLLTPNTVNGIERYLGSGLIKGVGPRFAARIVKAFGLDTLTILENEPEELLKVPGLGAKRLAGIRAAWQEQKAIHAIMIFLQGHGIPATYAVRIWKTYGQEALVKVTENPYRLAEDIWGIGFVTADRIAQALGIPSQDPRRARAGILHALNEAAGDGHCFLPADELLASAEQLLAVPRHLVADQIAPLAADGRLVVDQDAVYPAPLYHAERGAARSLGALVSGGTTFAINPAQAIPWAATRLKLAFAPEQAQAVEVALSHKAAVLTGGPGTGKTTILTALLLILEAKGATVQLAAPTGRAAKRLAEATGREAKTIHRLLEFDPSVRGFRRQADNPLSVDHLVVDEASMLDIVLANALFRAIPPAASLLLVGDVDQLPSVGPGAVLREIIASGRLPVVRLTRIFRQGEGSLISVNAARINRGEPLELLPDFKGDKDFYAIFRDEPEAIEAEILSLCRDRLPRRYGFDPVAEIQILAPMRRGLAGTDHLNSRLQEVLNPRGATLGGRSVFRVGDKVMQIRNNYDKEVFNGDLGLVQAMDREEGTLTVSFDGRRVTYELSELSELVLAYAITVHKSQGSEFPCIILPIHTSHYPMLQRNLLYTGVTRGRRLVVLVGSAKAVRMAIRSQREDCRHTRLATRLKA